MSIWIFKLKVMETALFAWHIRFLLLFGWMNSNQRWAKNGQWRSLQSLLELFLRIWIEVRLQINATVLRATSVKCNFDSLFMFHAHSSLLSLVCFIRSFRLHWNACPTVREACRRIAGPRLHLSQEERRVAEGGESIDYMPTCKCWTFSFLQRPPCQSTLFHAWETFLQEVEADSQSTSEQANLLSKQVGLIAN